MLSGEPKTRANSSSSEILGAAALGLLMGVLVGLSSAPVVATVVTALVALLAGLFGLSDRLPSLSASAAHRLMAFAFVAAIATPTFVWVRAGDYLAPSIQRQREMLEAMGVTDKKDQVELLKFLRLGIRPSGDERVLKEGQVTAPLPLTQHGVLYSLTPEQCEGLARLKNASVQDYIAFLADGPEELRQLARTISNLPVKSQQSAAEVASVYLCRRS